MKLINNYIEFISITGKNSTNINVLENYLFVKTYLRCQKLLKEFGYIQKNGINIIILIKNNPIIPKILKRFSLLKKQIDFKKQE